MGRMSDLWKPDPPANPTAPALEVIKEPQADESDWFANGDNIPFIEIGGPPEPTIRLAQPPVTEQEPTFREPARLLPLIADPLPPGVFTIRFRPVIDGTLPGRGFGPELIAYHDPEHPISEQYRLLCGEIALQLADGPPRVLLFTGAATEAGVTTVLLNVAITLARSGSHRITAVDANYDRPAFADKLGLAAGPGLCEVLAGRTPLPWALQDTRMNGLRALVAGHSAGHPAESGWPPLIDRLRNESDWILIDAPTWANAAESVPLADCCDGLYLVVRQSDTEAALDLQQDILQTTGRLKGCVLTQR